VVEGGHEWRKAGGSEQSIFIEVIMGGDKGKDGDGEMGLKS
jgi:hypothetical protein